MKQPSLLWAILLIPSVVRKLLEYNEVKMASSSWQMLTVFESITGIALFVIVGTWIGYEFSKDDSKTFDRWQETFRKEMKDHYDKIRESILAAEKENSHLKSQVDGLKSEIIQRERIIRLLDSSLQEERQRNSRTPEEANKQALEAIS